MNWRRWLGLKEKKPKLTALAARMNSSVLVTPTAQTVVYGSDGLISDFSNPLNPLSPLNPLNTSGFESPASIPDDPTPTGHQYVPEPYTPSDTSSSDSSGSDYSSSGGSDGGSSDGGSSGSD